MNEDKAVPSMSPQLQEPKSIDIKVPKIAVETLGYFRYGRIGKRVILTNDAGEWVLISSEESMHF